MDQAQFEQFLKRGGRSESARRRVLERVAEYERFLLDERDGTALEQSRAEDLEEFVDWLERDANNSAKTHLWALRYFYQYTGNEELSALAAALREHRIQRKPFELQGFRGIEPSHVQKLAGSGIRNVRQMLRAGRTPSARQELAEAIGVPLEAVVELVKLSDLGRIPGIKGIRARLYHDAGVDTVQKLADWDPEALRVALVDFVERTGFEGIAPLPAEVRYSVRQAQALERVVEY